MSAGLTTAPTMVSDYETSQPKTVSNNSGPKCHKCNRPFRQCACPPVIDVPGENVAMETPPARQANALELLAHQSGKVVKLLEKIVDHLDKLAPVLPAPSVEVPIMPIAMPGVTDVPGPTIDAATLAANEAKKAEVLARTKNLK